MHRKKTIGIIGYSMGDNSFGAGKLHLDYLSRFGKPRILMPTDEDVEDVDLLYLPGGLDLNPSNYGQVPGFFTSNSDVYKEYFYRVMLPKYVEANVPIFGVCLGFQMLNVFFGGSLTQHLPDHPESSMRGRAGHRILKVVDVEEGGFILEHKKTKEGKEIGGFEVNSHHHQGVLIENLSKEFEPLYASLDGVVEIMQHKTKPIFCIQSHPKFFGAC